MKPAPWQNHLLTKFVGHGRSSLTAQDAVTDAVTDAVPVADLCVQGGVIAPEGGMVGRLITPFKMGTGGKFGNGQQIMSWISRTDLVRAVILSLNKPDSHPAHSANLQFDQSNAY